jgi:UDP-N-acetylmuramate dehydrogenase
MEALQRLKRQLNTQGITCQADVCLAPYTTFHIGGPAALLVEPRDEEQLVSTLRAIRESGVYALVLGRGSNLLLPDEGIRGVVVRTCALDAITTEGHTLTARGGASLAQITRTAQKAGLSGLEFAYGIPGTLGGALFMNAGAYGGEMSQVVTSVRLYDADKDEIMVLSGEQMQFAYRHSVLQAHPEWSVLSATLTLVPDDAEHIDSRMQDYMTRRREKQPLNYPSAGSVFKRPAGAFAGALIEESGLKGYSVGGAMVSQKHAGFIVNTGGATARDVVVLIEHIKQTVYRDHGIELETEIHILNAHLAR